MTSLLLAILLQGSVAMAEEPQSEALDLKMSEKTGYQECLGEMEGHATAETTLKICRAGNGTYVDHKGVMQVLRATDWFPFSKFSTLVGEVRITCASEAGTTKRQIVFPARSEQGRRVRIEVPCRLAAAAIRQSMQTAQLLLLSGLKDRAKFAQLAAQALPGCKAKPKLESCVRYATLVKDTVAGTGTADVNGRPFGFAVQGFEFRAGLEPAPKKINDDVNSTDPIVRMRAYMRLRDEMDDREWRDQTSSIFDSLGIEAQRQLVEEAIEDADGRVRDWGMGNVSLLKDDRLAQAIARGLDDSNPSVRSKTLPFVAKLGETYVVRALHDPLLGNRELAYDILINNSAVRLPTEQMIHYLEMGLNDPEASIRDMAQGKLEFIRNRDRVEDLTPKDP